MYISDGYAYGSASEQSAHGNPSPGKSSIVGVSCDRGSVRTYCIRRMFVPFLTATNGSLSRNNGGSPLVRGRVNAIASNDSNILEFKVHLASCTSEWLPRHVKPVWLVMMATYTKNIFWFVQCCKRKVRWIAS